MHNSQLQPGLLEWPWCMALLEWSAMLEGAFHEGLALRWRYAPRPDSCFAAFACDNVARLDALQDICQSMSRCHLRTPICD